MNDIFIRNNINLEKTAAHDIASFRYHLTTRRKLLCSLLKSVLFSKYRFTFSNNGGKIIFLVGLSSSRFNEKQTYSKIRQCTNNYDMINMIHKKRLSNVLYNIYLICRYYYFFCKQKISTEEILINLRIIIRIYPFLRFLEMARLKTYAAGVVYNDLDQYDNVFVQYLKNNGIKTITCQHGMFNAFRPNGGLYFSGLELQNSIADIFLAWNQMTYDEAVLSGMEPSKIRILGIPKCIGNVSCTKQEPKKAFGVVLNHINFSDYNICLIQAANYVADKNGMKYYVKFHPSLDLSAYDGYLDKRYAIKLPIKTSVAEYADLVDFSILSHSTVYVELLFLKSKVYLLHVDNFCKFTHFPEYDFSSKEELDELIHKEYDVDKMFNYYCFTDNPKQEYVRFFEEIEKA